VSSPSPRPERKVQVAPEHYEFESYDDMQRWSSYWYQIRSALHLRPTTALEIGSGSGVFRSYLRNAGVDVRSADIDATRHPDYLVDVARLDETLPADLRFDVVAAFQVLEHLPFSELDACLAGLARRGRHALISLPCNGWQLRASLAVGALKWKFGVYLLYPYRHRFNSQHHWELGPGYSVRKITRMMERTFDVKERFRIEENPYHYMWVLRSKSFAEPA
jgi:2-polyprenyl-3-methyl-5-hydroxy-6-metoxy-1,4-benzoquinol methylase